MKKSTKVVLTMLGSVALTITANGCNVGCVGPRRDAREVQKANQIYQGHTGTYYHTGYTGYAGRGVSPGGAGAVGSPSSGLVGGGDAASTGGVSRGGFGGYGGHASAS